MYPVDHTINIFMVPIATEEKIISFWPKFTMPTSVQTILILSNCFGLLEHENDPKTLFSYIFDVKGFGK